MKKIRLYLPREIKTALTHAASARGCSEAQLIRELLRAAASRASPPAPRLPLFHSGKRHLATRIGRALAAFGDR
jgi:hypothetical protein